MKTKTVKMRKYWIKYSVYAIVLILIMYCWVIPGQISFSLSGDNYRQHYYALMNIGKWYRELFENILYYHKLKVPFYDYNLQYGAGILETYSYYGMYDPLNLLSAFVPAKYTEYLFWILMAFRTYLMGITFSLFGKYKEIEENTVLVGALIYMTCGFNLGACMSQIIFQPALVMFPLLFLGANIMLKDGKPWVYIFSTLVFACSTLYFYYMAVIALVLYCVVWCLVRKKKIKIIVNLIIRFVYSSLIGIGLGAVCLMPEIFTILNNNRMSVEYDVPFLYELRYYLGLPGRLLNTGSIYSEYLGFSSVSIILFLCFSFKKKRKNDEKVLAIISILGMIALLIPYIGHVLNGMSYIGNRWTYMLAFLMAYISIIMLQRIDEIDISVIKKCLIAWSSIIIGIMAFKDSRGMVTYLGIATGTIFLLGMVVIKNGWFEVYNKLLFSNYNFISIIIVFIYVFNITLPVLEQYNNRIKLGEAFDYAVTDNIASLVDGEDSSFYRIDYSNGALISYNQNLMANKKGVEYYWSTASGIIQNFISDLGVSTYYGMMSRGVDGRNYLEHYLGVKYFVVKDGEEIQKPFLYNVVSQKIDVKDSKFTVYTNEQADFGLVRFFSDTISKEEFQNLNYAGRQEVLFKAAVVETDSFKENINVNQSKVINYSVEESNNIEIEENKFIVKKDGSYLRMKIENDSLKSTAGGEVYVIFEGIDYLPYNPYRDFNGNTISEKWNSVCNYIKWIPYDIAEIQCGYGEVWKSIKYPTARNQYGYGRDSFCCNLGYFDTRVDDYIQLYFPNSGEYVIENISIVMNPLTELNTITNGMYDNITVNNLNCTSNGIQFMANVSEAGVIQIALPYNKSWTAYVDGRKTDILSDVLFMDVFVDEGEHDIKLVYTPYGIKCGSIITFCSIVAMLFIALVEKKYHKNI